MTYILASLYALVALEALLDFWVSEEGSLIRKVRGLGKLLIAVHLAACLLWPIPALISLVLNTTKLFRRSKSVEPEDLPPS